MLKSRNYQPPNGFIFFQPETGWSAPEWAGFNEQVQNIINHRKSNPRFNLATDTASVEQELDTYTEMRLRSIYGAQADQWVAGTPAMASPNPLWQPLRRRDQAAAAVGNSARKTMSSVGTIMSWLGSGLKPVDQTIANSRALICSMCEKNVRSEGIRKAIATIGDTLHAIASAKADLKLATPYDDKLETCSACGCVAGTKVWVPADHIKKGMTPEVESALSVECWIRPLLK